MHFTAPSIALLALAAGVQAGGAKQQREPPVRRGKGFDKHQTTSVATGAATGIHGHETGIVGTGVHTGSHPIVTGIPYSSGTHGGGKDTTLFGTGTAPCYNCHGSATIPVYVPTQTHGGSSGASPSGGAGGAHASPSSTEYTPSNPGSKVTAPQVGVVGAVIGSIVYGAVMLLA
ncbi:uncharacterized protein N7500_009124 [Penicillium coprophilum]|uniref:uncharacterized protein n=1 Tax=Penicillium coprophilum TaxID=36646 RepID=UPI0023A0DDDC|nr:uncharacterized protein N7500_009124 [Penicillium coprophilum]KAJ5153685.1 hypothetical protein N7500_009124 [Penicillium coprophilum]